MNCFKGRQTNARSPGLQFTWVSALALQIGAAGPQGSVTGRCRAPSRNGSMTGRRIVPPEERQRSEIFGSPWRSLEKIGEAMKNERMSTEMCGDLRARKRCAAVRSASESLKAWIRDENRIPFRIKRSSLRAGKNCCGSEDERRAA